MGTRNLTIVHSNGEYKVAQYGHWDGYPEGLGVQLLEYLKGININELRNSVNDCTYLSKEDFDEINKNIDEANNSENNNDNIDKRKKKINIIIIHVVASNIDKLKHFLNILYQ